MATSRPRAQNRASRVRGAAARRLHARCNARKPAWMLAMRGAARRTCVRPKAFGNALGDSIVANSQSGVDWSKAPDESAAETARLSRLTPAQQRVLELGKGPLTAAAAQREYQETFADATETLRERSERKTLREFASVDPTMRTAPSIDLRGFGQQALLSDVYGEGYTTFRSGTYEGGDMWVEETYHKNPMLTMAAGAVLTAEVNWGSPQLKAAALLTLGGVAAMQFAGDSPNYGGPIIDPIPPMPPSGPMVTPADTRQGPFITSYPAGEFASPELEGLPIARPGNPGPVGGGFAAGGVPDQSPLMLKTPAEILSDNLEAAGFKRPDESAAHHMVSESHRRAADLKDRLIALGIGINDAENGVFLPQVPGSQAPGAYHPSLHNNDYYNQLQRDFIDVNTKDRAIEVLANIRSQLLNGTYPGSKPVPPKLP
jgi:A nuclease family of the HNH/ENDO VII superfamily with conserved AHH